jgi:multicomponent Na+:H+ antiporter subunit E
MMATAKGANLHRRELRVRGLIIQTLLLMGLWLLLSGLFDLYHIALGIFSVALVALLNLRIHRLKLSPDDFHDLEPIRILPLVRYIFWLFWEIVVGSLQVAYVVLHPKTPVDPSLLRFRVRLPNLAAKVILGNSITLTPGTVTVDIRRNEFLVHALMPESASNLLDGTMARQVARLFRKTSGQVISEIKIIKSGRRV